jgi:hypothetical protein
VVAINFAAEQTRDWRRTHGNPSESILPINHADFLTGDVDGTTVNLLMRATRTPIRSLRLRRTN